MPNDKTEVKQFLRLAIDIRKENLRMLSNSDCHVDFKALKKTLTEIAVLRMMDLLEKGLVLCTDVSDMAIGFILMQEYMVLLMKLKN
jgi:hypothetical protein